MQGQSNHEPMMFRFRVVAMVALVGVMTGAGAHAQSDVWDLFDDAVSGSACDLINGGELNGLTSEFVVSTATGELILVTGEDVILDDSFVDAEANVFFGGQSFGFISFAEDADGFRTLWWLDDFGYVFALDTSTWWPFATAQTPDEFADVPCDACDYWDDPADCITPPVPSDPDPIVSTPSISFSFCGQGMLAGILLSFFGLCAVGRFRPRVR